MRETMAVFSRSNEQQIRALPWRTDIPDRRPQRPHEHCRGSLVGGLAWSYCRRHRRWEAT